MSKFVPKFVNEKDDTFVLLDNAFCHEEAIEWAKKHKHNVKFMCGTYTCATEILCKLQEAGYSFKFIRRDIGQDVHCEIIVFDTVYCYLTEEE